MSARAFASVDSQEDTLDLEEIAKRLDVSEKDVDHLKLYEASHDARVNTLWEAQHRWNEKQEMEKTTSTLAFDKKIEKQGTILQGQIERLANAIQSLERRLFLLVGAASAGGAFLGAAMRSWFDALS